jgi:LysR family transcriptional regulator, low CO2-responsive transcriptional regulator
MIRAEWLEAFIAFAEELSFTRAAARLHISQPAFHVQIRRLGEAVGATLYERRGRNLVLAPHGRELLAFARETRDRTEAFLAHLGSAPERSPVVLAAGEGTLLYILAPALGQAVAEGKLRLRVLTRDREGTFAAVATGEAQLGVAATEVVPDRLRATRVHRARMVLIVPRTHRLARQRRIQLKDLEGERLIVPPAASPHRQMLARALGAAGVSWEIAVEAGGWPLMLAYARAGVGLAVVNDICPPPRGTVARPIVELPSIDYNLVQRPGAALSGDAEMLRTLIVSAFAERRAAGKAA